MVSGKSNSWPYYYSQSEMHAQGMVPLQQDKNELECGGNDAGKAECWPQLVNIGVPILCCAIFLVVIVVIYITSKPKGTNKNNIKQTEDTSTAPHKHYEKHANPGLSVETLSQTEVPQPISSTQTVNQSVSINMNVQTDNIATHL